MIGNNFFDIMIYQIFMGHQRYVLLCTETTLSNHPEVFLKPNCNVHLLRSPWITIQTHLSIELNFYEEQIYEYLEY